MMIAWRLAFLLLAWSASTVFATEPLERLFFTAEQRALLDRQRRSGSEPEAGMLSVGGAVARSSGKTTVWINGRPQHENSADDGLHAKVSERTPGSVVVVLGATAVTLRVSETLDRETGRRSGAIDAGSVRVHRPDHARAGGP